MLRNTFAIVSLSLVVTACAAEGPSAPPAATAPAASRPQAAAQPPRDATVAGTNFNATGNIPCARTAGQRTADCRFGVVRRGGGNGDVTVFWPDGGNRVIFFERGRPVGFDQSQADGNARMNVRKNADTFMITIGPQRFEIPEAVILGG